MAPLQGVLLAATFFNVISCSPPYTFANPSATGKPYTRPADFNPVAVPNVTSAGQPVLESFVSYSIEFAFFPDFAGNKSTPNVFSDNLLENLKVFQGSKPDIRVGGNTQDYALFNASLETATRGIYTNVSLDYPRILTIGPSFFESYQTWDSVKFIHGFNLAKNGSVAASSINNSVPYACRAFSTRNFLYWEMGNEPDLYKTSAQGIMRPASWNETDYVREWEGKVTAVKQQLASSCGAEWVSAQKFKWLAPSFAGTNNSLKPLKTWTAGLKNDQDIIAKFSSHNYIGGATQPGVTLAGTLLNHTKTRSSVAAHTSSRAALAAAGLTLDYILGETNSLYNEGAPGLSNSFGAALWGLDFNLLCAASSIKQVFMHQGTDYRYASWQPVNTAKTTKGTKAPYYGNVAVAAALGDVSRSAVRVASLPLPGEPSTSAAYAVFANSTLARIVVVNMNQYNYSSSSATSAPSSLSVRPAPLYNFTLPASCMGTATVQRLMANGSDAITGITFNGMSYNYELEEGKGRLLGNATRDEVVWVGGDGGVSVRVPDSSAAVVQVRC